MTQDKYEHARQNAEGWLQTLDDLRTRYEAATLTDDMSAAEAVEREILDAPLSVMVRSTWHEPGQDTDPQEYEILLTTGGPALRITGQLDEYCERVSAELQGQDWGVPWLRMDAPDDLLRWFASFFSYGE